jgi:hypothetical protein
LAICALICNTPVLVLDGLAATVRGSVFERRRLHAERRGASLRVVRRARAQDSSCHSSGSESVAACVLADVSRLHSDPVGR